VGLSHVNKGAEAIVGPVNRKKKSIVFEREGQSKSAAPIEREE